MLDYFWGHSPYFFTFMFRDGAVGEEMKLYRPLPWWCLQVLHVAFVTRPANGGYTYRHLLLSSLPQMWVNYTLSALQMPSNRALEICWPLSPGIDARILWSKELCLSREMSILKHVSAPLPSFISASQSSWWKLFVFTPDPTEMEILQKRCVFILGLNSFYFKYFVLL